MGHTSPISIWLRLKALWKRRQLDRDLEDELRFHLEMRKQQARGEGAVPEEAHYAARRRFGNLTSLKEACRDMWTLGWVETLWQDIRFGARMLRKNPGFTAVAVLTLALGIGANTAIFSVVNGVLLSPLTFKNPERLVDVWVSNPKHGVLRGATSYPEFLDWKKHNSVLASAAVYRENQGTTLAGAGDPVRIHAAIVSPGFFEVLGVGPLMGRTFSPKDDVAGKANVAILSRELWQTQFHSDPSILGRSVAIAGKPYTIVGVMRSGFQFPILAEPIDAWIPLAAYDGPMPTQRGVHIYSTIGRLRPGVSTEQATSQINTIESRLALQYPDNHTPGDGAIVSPLLPDLVSSTRDALLVLFGAVAILLLIACANVANLSLIRATSRFRELAIRRALGAQRARLIQQSLAEAMLLSALAGVFGLLSGSWVINVLVRLGPRDIPRLASTHLDSHVFGFTLAISLLTSVLFGLAPSLRTFKMNLSDSLKDRLPAGAGKGGRHLREALVVSEIALSLVLVAAAGLLLRTLWRLENVNLGFDSDHVLTFATGLPAGYSDAQTTAFYADFLPRLRALPGAEEVSAAFPLPFSGNGITTQFSIEGRPSLPGSPTTADLSVADRNYFRTMHIPLLRGREFQEQDGQSGKWVAIVNQAFARRYFPNEDPLGKRIKSEAETKSTPSQMSEIIGVVADIKLASLRDESKPIVFVPIRQLPLGALRVVIRSRQAPGTLMPAVREQVHAAAPAALIFRGRTLDQYLSVSLGQPRFDGLLLGTFAALALVLSVVGLYGAVAYTVSERTNEIGIRMALGAERRDVLRLVIGQGMTLAVVGVGIGILGAFALTRLMGTLLYGISASDPLTFTGVALLMTLVALLACWIPARRAMRVDPMVALRYE